MYSTISYMESLIHGPAPVWRQVGMRMMWVLQKPSLRVMPRSPYKKCADPFLNTLCDWSHPVPWLRSMLRSYLIDGLPGCQLKDFNILRVRPWTRPGASAVRGLRSWRPRMGHAAPRRSMQQTVVDERTAAHVSPPNTRCFT